LKPFSNKINIPLLIIAIGLLGYFIIALTTILTGVAQLVGPIYPLYISIGVLILSILGIVASINARGKWERNHVNAGRF
jgi:hypothetical protein